MSIFQEYLTKEIDQKNKLKEKMIFEKQNRNFAGSRRAHVRKLPDGYKSSKSSDVAR